MSGHGHATEHAINDTCSCCDRATVQPFGPMQGVCPDCHGGRCQEKPAAADGVRDLAARQIRADLAKAQEELCPCGSGVRPEHCLEHRAPAAPVEEAAP